MNAVLVAKGLHQDVEPNFEPVLRVLEDVGLDEHLVELGNRGITDDGRRNMHATIVLGSTPPGPAADWHLP